MYELPMRIQTLVDDLEKIKQDDEVVYLNSQDRKYIIRALQETYKVWVEGVST